MGMLEIVGGVILIVLCILIIAVVTAQESKSSGLGAIAGESGTFYNKNRGKTKDAMLIRATIILGIALVAVTLIVQFASFR